METRLASLATRCTFRGQRRRRVTRCLQRVASSVATDGDVFDFGKRDHCRPCLHEAQATPAMIASGMPIHNTPTATNTSTRCWLISVARQLASFAAKRE